MGSDGFSDLGSHKADINRSARLSSNLETWENPFSGLSGCHWNLVPHACVLARGLPPPLKPTLQSLHLQSSKQLIKSGTSYPPHAGLESDSHWSDFFIHY